MIESTGEIAMSMISKKSSYNPGSESPVIRNIILVAILLALSSFVGILYYQTYIKECYEPRDIGWSLVLYSDKEAQLINGIKYDVFYVQLPGREDDDTEKNSQVEVFVRSETPENSLMTKFAFPHSLSVRKEVFVIQQFHRAIPGRESPPLYSIKRRL